MSFDKQTSVKRHIRDGRSVKRHFRRLKKDMKKVVDPTRDQIEIIEVNEIGVIELPAEVYNQIVTAVTNPLEAIREAGFDDSHLQELVELNGISETGEVVIRNATNGALKRVPLLNLQQQE